MTDRFVKADGKTFSIEEGDKFITSEGTFKYTKKRTEAPEFFVRMLLSGEEIFRRAFDYDKSLIAVFYILAYRMNDANYVRISTPELASILKVKDEQASRIISKMEHAKLLKRTGTRALLMLNPSIVCKCKADKLIDIQLDWLGGADLSIKDE